MRCLTLLVTLLAIGSTALHAQTSPPAAPAAPPYPAAAIRPNDRVLFVGDELTQQMMYTRGVAAALLSIHPNGNLWFYNGGKDEATTADALGFIDDLLSITRPTVVVVCLGLNDGRAGAAADDSAVAPGQGSPDAAVGPYRQNLARLVDIIKKFDGVREVAVMTPPPYQVGIGADGKVFGYNLTLAAMAQAALDVAREKQVRGIDLFEHMRIVYDEANRTAGEPLTLAGKLPNEVGHTVIASVVLYGLGVRAAELAPKGWSPVVPLKMRKVRNVLALDLPAPGLEDAQRSRVLYVSIASFDEKFFRYWRLANRKPSGPRRPEMRPELELAWAQVQELASRVYGGGR